MAVLRRLLSILLLAGCFLPMLAPLLAYGHSNDLLLPACCRRTGKHRCALTMGETSRPAVVDAALRWTAPVEQCPYSPASLVSNPFHEKLAAMPPSGFYAAMRSHPGHATQPECRRSTAQDRSSRKRGPPFLLS